MRVNIRLYIVLGLFELMGCKYNLVLQLEEKEKALKISLFSADYEEVKNFQRTMEEIIQEGKQSDNNCKGAKIRKMIQYSMHNNACVIRMLRRKIKQRGSREELKIVQLELIRRMRLSSDRVY